MISPVFAQILRSGREHFNGRFQLARRVRPDLNGAALAAFLETSVDGLVQSVHRVRPERATDVATTAYDLALDLLGQRLIGPGARLAWIEEGWRRLAPGVASLVAMAPERVLAALSNALHALATSSGARPDAWLTALERLGPGCADVQTWLRLGQVAAWRAGLAHYRASALVAADALTEPLALAAIGAPATARWPAMRDQLLATPWFDPAQPIAAPTPRLAMRAGAFRGFGGVFTSLPRVGNAGEHFVVASGEDSWLLTADAFGATFHRAQPHEVGPRDEDTPPPPLGVRVLRGAVEIRGHRLDLPELGEITSVAANASTVALTARRSYAVMLIALPSP
jgi:hypothetical protein